MELMRMGDSIKSKVIYRKFLKKRDENGNLDDVTLSMDH